MSLPGKRRLTVRDDQIEGANEEGFGILNFEEGMLIVRKVFVRHAEGYNLTTLDDRNAYLPRPGPTATKIWNIAEPGYLTQGEI